MKKILFPLLFDSEDEGPFTILGSFGSGTYPGFYYDAFNVPTLFKDTAGTDPVTADSDATARVNDLDTSTAQNATQATLANRPLYKTAAGVHWLDFDGTDYLTSTLAPVATGMTIAFCGRAATAGTAFMGAADGGAVNRIQLSLQGTTGFLAGAWGSGTPATICGSVDRRGSDVVGLLRANASVVELWENGVRVFQGAPSISSMTTNAFMIGCLNAATPLNFITGRINRAYAIQRFIPDNNVVPLMQTIGSGVVVI